MEGPMGGLSNWHWLFFLIYLGFVCLYFSGAVRILNRVGFSGWWSLLTIVPLVNFIAIFLFSRAKWPRMEAASGVFD
jgi:uncharacterized membrane protein YhaH (DUF805 family)